VSDPVERLRIKNHLAREQLVAYRSFALIQAELSDCYFRHGANRREMCVDIVKEYLQELRKITHYDTGYF